ncbi:pyruvate dehydrogenase complex dihydrolipoamide acetyltransferase (plasmid) [Rhizobium sp. ACO-34A]|nr:pyruvate dehydrogenase complex dihydrolipoamide acetyltransferase [Rhizobium sp. ACO-34A]ATN37305.1 pyruvate dehydrogenase complex dihydrolipoamide acetyltransferase [Rhizobium sp. ACO-34A]
MAYEIVLPALSAGMEEAVIARWLKAEGDRVAKGEPIAEVETDKATMELEAEQDGLIGKLLVSAGDRAAVNQVIAVLVNEGEDAASLSVAAERRPPAPAAVTSSAIVSATTADAIGATSVRHKASPLARRLAVERGVPLDGITGTGWKGRIVRVDVERAILPTSTGPLVSTPSPDMGLAGIGAIPVGIGEYTSVPHTNMRRTIARRLLESKTTVPHFYLTADCEMDALLALRARINETRDSASRISVNDFVIKAVAHALRAVPNANVMWTDEAMLQLHDVDIAVAVATDGGLITPVIRKADQKSLGTISAEMKSLAARARDGRLKPEEFQGGGFSISNLGMYGVRTFSAIINPPQSGILAVGATGRRAVERDGQLAFVTMMECTISVDHRAVDGAVGASWLQAFKRAVEEPMTLLI